MIIYNIKVNFQWCTVSTNNREPLTNIGNNISYDNDLSVFKMTPMFYIEDENILNETQNTNLHRTKITIRRATPLSLSALY